MFIPEYKGNQTKIPVLSMGYFLLRFWLWIFQSSTNQQRSYSLPQELNGRTLFIAKKHHFGHFTWRNQAHTDLETSSLLGSFQKTGRYFVD